MLSIVSVTSSAPSRRGSIYSGATALCKSCLLRPAAVSKTPVRSSFCPQSLFPDRPSRLGRRSQTQGDCLRGPGKRPGLRHWTLAAQGGSGSLEAAPYLGRGQDSARPKRAPYSYSYRGRALDYLGGSQNVAGPLQTHFLPGLWAATWATAYPPLLANSGPFQGLRPAPGSGPHWAEVPLTPTGCPHVSPFPCYLFQRNHAGKRWAGGAPTWVRRASGKTEFGTKCKRGEPGWGVGAGLC